MQIGNPSMMMMFSFARARKFFNFEFLTGVQGKDKHQKKGRDRQGRLCQAALRDHTRRLSIWQ
jgi:hypothetical protein